MKLNRTIAVVIATGAAVVVATPANATPKGATGCPGGYQVKSVSFVLSQAAPGFEGAIVAADENGDQKLCYKLLPGPIPLYEPTFLFDDNNVPVR